MVRTEPFITDPFITDPFTTDRVYNQVRIEGEKEVIAQRPVAIVPAMKISGLFYDNFWFFEKIGIILDSFATFPT